MVGLILYWGLLCVYLLVPGGTPGTAITESLPGRDWTAHSIAFGGLAFLLCCVLAGGKTSAVRTASLSIIVAMTYAALMELVQTLLPWRTGSITDFVANVPGVVLACGGWVGWRRVAPVLRANPSRNDEAHSGESRRAASRVRQTLP